jgi:hypothetical protein
MPDIKTALSALMSMMLGRGDGKPRGGSYGPNKYGDTPVTDTYYANRFPGNGDPEPFSPGRYGPTQSGQPPAEILEILRQLLSVTQPGFGKLDQQPPRGSLLPQAKAGGLLNNNRGTGLLPDQEDEIIYDMLRSGLMREDR